MTCSNLIRAIPDPAFIFGSIQSCSWPVSDNLTLRDYVTVLEVGLGDLSWAEYYAKEDTPLHIEMEAAQEIVVPYLSGTWARMFGIELPN